jgi:hypothetical protein
LASFAVAWFSADEIEDLHEWAGYAAAALIAFRLARVAHTSGLSCNVPIQEFRSGRPSFRANGTSREPSAVAIRSDT